MRTITIPKPRWYAWWLDEYMKPVMYLLSGTLSESPQETHPWNRHSLAKDDVRLLQESHMVRCGKMFGRARWFGWVPVFHIPVIGGWRDYFVIVPRKELREGEVWYAGWIADDVIGVSQIPLTGPVRLLRGSVDARFFGLDTDGNQISVQLIGTGRIGDGGPFSQVPLR